MKFLYFVIKNVFLVILYKFNFNIILMTLFILLNQFKKKLNSIYSTLEIEIIFYYIAEKLFNQNVFYLTKNKYKKISNFYLKKDRFNQFLLNLIMYMPYQYVLGESYFFGKKFFVNSNVLITRPETEELTDWVIKETIHPNTILDIGTGSGCIAIILKKHFSESKIFAVDKCHKALEIAKKNAKIYDTEINFINYDFLDETSWKILPVFDLIVSNPPYIPEYEKKIMSKSVINFEPHLALFVPNHNPFIFYEKILKFSSLHLSKQGIIFLEIHQNFASNLINLILKFFNNFEIRKDLSGNDRMIKITNF